MLSKLVSALDSAQNFQVGENGHVELGWSNNVQEKILQFYFQLVRTKDVESLAITYRSILIELFNSKHTISQEKILEYGMIAYKLIAQTRDIVSGKGEYTLAHMMIWEWSNVCNIVKNEYKEFTMNVSKHALKSLVYGENSEHPLGSWKDVKYFLNYGKNMHVNISNKFNIELIFEKEELFQYAISLISEQLHKDMHEYKQDGGVKNISLAAKWAPREHSNKFGWITPYIADEYFSNEGWESTAVTNDQIVRLKNKKLTQYRILLSMLNKELDTVQIKQCGNNWRHINFDKKVTSITLSKQKYAFKNVTKKGKERYSDNKDRTECANNYTEYIGKCVTGELKIKGKRVSIYDFVKDAVEHNDETFSNKTILDTINLQWNDNSLQNCALENMIALVDTSASMTCDNNLPLYNAIGLGIRIAEKSTLGKRVMTFSSTPSWVNLDGCPDFVSMVSEVKRAPWGMTTNFYAAFNMILDAYLAMDVPPSKVDNMVLTILSDMQIDTSDDVMKSPKRETMFDTMTTKFEEAGIRSKYNTPYKLPIIVFWNLRKTNGFPTTSYSENAIMISGYSPVLLNSFMNGGIQALKECTPWKLFVQQLSSTRYDSFNRIFKDEFEKVHSNSLMPPPPPSFDCEL